MPVLVIEDQALVEEIEQIAQEEQRAPVEVIADAVQWYRTSHPKLSSLDFLEAITALGSSEEGYLSERNEAILAAEIDPIRGWGLPRDAKPG